VRLRRTRASFRILKGAIQVHRCAFAVLACVVLFARLAAANDEAGASALAALEAAGSYDEKAGAAGALSASEHPRAVTILSAMLDGALYTTRDGERLVIASDAPEGYAIRDAVTDEDLGTAGRRDVSRVSVNNQLRSTLRGLIATLKLTHDDPKQRIAAIDEVGRSGDMELLAALETLRDAETHRGVLRALDTAIATINLDSPEPAVRLAAIDAVSGNVSSHVRTKLTRLAADDIDDAATREAAAAAIDAIETKVELFELIRTAFFGLSLGSILVLAAIGLSVTFGIMGVINMAHGELMMIGAYTTYVVQQAFPGAIESSLFIAMPAAFLIAAAFGVAIERGIVRFLYGRPLETLLATFGVSLILQQAVRTIFSPLNRSVITPQWMSGSLEIVPGLAITYNRLYILIFALLVFAALMLVLRRTRLGLEMRAVTQNRAMAKAMGVRTDRVDAMTFALGSGIAGLAGVALSQLTNVGPNLGQQYIVDSFMVVVFGGVGSLWGTLVSGLSLGVVSKLLEPTAGAVMAKIFVLVFLIIFIQKRPRGLFPQKGRAAEG
jgi:urea transport system permease protein